MKYKIKNEVGEPIDFKDHIYLYDIYNDLSPKQVCMKAAQIGFSTMAILKTIWLAKTQKMDIIYSLPTQTDVNNFVGGKINRIIQNNGILQQFTADKDTVDQKQIINSMIYYRGTFTEKAALMVSADLYCADEVDRSKSPIVEQYASRLQHSKYKWEWRFSNPSVVGHGVSNQWELSDQMHWFVKCSHCNERQYMDWPDSFNEDKQMYVCKHCGKEIYPDDIRQGQWVAKYLNKDWRGYWIPYWLYPLATAKQVIDYHNTKTPEYFANFVAGKPYVGEGNSIPQDVLWRNLTDEINSQENVVIGCDSGIKKHYVLGNSQGLFYYGVTEDWDTIRGFLKRFKRSVCVIDHLPDITGPRMLREEFPGRVFLCHYAADRKTMGLFKWGEKDESGNVVADRNRTIQTVIDEMADMRIPLQGTKNDWLQFYSQLKSSYKVIEPNALGVPVFRWESDGNDHWLHALVYWRVGMDRFGRVGGGKFILPKDKRDKEIENAVYVDPLTNKATINPFRKDGKLPETWWRP